MGGQPNISGIRAQEALLTLIENEAVPFTLPDWAGGGMVNVDSSGLLFVCAGAFEGLYDAVYERVTVDRAEFTLAGDLRFLPTEPDWTGASVVVWAVVDLGFRHFHSPPLVLGRLGEKKRKPWQLFSSRPTDQETSASEGGQA